MRSFKVKLERFNKAGSWNLLVPEKNPLISVNKEVMLRMKLGSMNT